MVFAAALGLAASGCAQSMSEFAQVSSTTPAATTAPASAPLGLAGAPQAGEAAAGTGVARPAVLVEETTVRAPAAASAAAPMTLAPPARSVAAAPLPAPTAGGTGQTAEHPASKLLTPDEKAKVIAELEALARSQSAGLARDARSADCEKEKLKPAQRVASATGDGEC